MEVNRMYRMSDNRRVNDGFWSGVKRLLFGSSSPEAEFEEGDKIRFKRQNGQKASGIVKNVYANVEEKRIDYGVQSSVTLDNIVVPEDNIIVEEKNNNKQRDDRRIRDFAHRTESPTEIEDLEDEIRESIADISVGGDMRRPTVDFDDLILMLEDDYGYKYIASNPEQECYEFFNDGLESDLYVYPKNYESNPDVISIHNIGVF